MLNFPFKLYFLEFDFVFIEGFSLQKFERFIYFQEILRHNDLKRSILISCG